MIHEISTHRARMIVLPFRHLASEQRVAMVETLAREWVDEHSAHWDSINEWIQTLGIKGIGRELKIAVHRLERRK